MVWAAHMPMFVAGGKFVCEISFLSKNNKRILCLRERAWWPKGYGLQTCPCSWLAVSLSVKYFHCEKRKKKKFLCERAWPKGCGLHTCPCSCLAVNSSVKFVFLSKRKKCIFFPFVRGRDESDVGCSHAHVRSRWWACLWLICSNGLWLICCN